jgi:hypothetical protein
MNEQMDWPSHAVLSSAETSTARVLYVVLANFMSGRWTSPVNSDNSGALRNYTRIQRQILLYEIESIKRLMDVFTP